MAKVVTDDKYYKSIADKLRDISNTEEKFSPDSMAEAVSEVYEAGTEDGKQAQYDEFWDNYQAHGTRSDYGRAFAGMGWNNTVFTPKYDMNVGYGYQMFLGNKNITDLKSTLERCNVTLNLANGYELYGLFQACTTLTHLPALTIPNSSGLSTTFYQCHALKTIDCLYLPNGGTFDRTFYQCNVLEDIVIEGVIATNLDMRWSPLTKASIASIIEHLSDTTTGKTLTLKKTAVENAFSWRFAKDAIHSLFIMSISDTESANYYAQYEPEFDWGDGVEIGEYILVADGDGLTKVVLKKTGINIDEETGVDHGLWEFIGRFEGTYIDEIIEADIGEYNHEWTALVESKSNWTISLA